MLLWDLRSQLESLRRFGIWEFPKIRGTLFWDLKRRILLFRVLY